MKKNKSKTGTGAPIPPVKVNNYKTLATTVAKGVGEVVPPEKRLANKPTVYNPTPGAGQSTKVAQDVVPVVNGKVSPELVVKKSYKKDNFIPALKPKKRK